MIKTFLISNLIYLVMASALVYASSFTWAYMHAPEGMSKKGAGFKLANFASKCFLLGSVSGFVIIGVIGGLAYSATKLAIALS